MRWDEIRGMPCSVARALSVVGDRWTLLILRDALLGARRYDQFQQSLNDIGEFIAERFFSAAV